MHLPLKPGSQAVAPAAALEGHTPELHSQQRHRGAVCHPRRGSEAGLLRLGLSGHRSEPSPGSEEGGHHPDDPGGLPECRPAEEGAVLGRHEEQPSVPLRGWGWGQGVGKDLRIPPFSGEEAKLPGFPAHTPQPVSGSDLNHPLSPRAGCEAPAPPVLPGVGQSARPSSGPNSPPGPS